MLDAIFGNSYFLAALIIGLGVLLFAVFNYFKRGTSSVISKEGNKEVFVLRPRDHRLLPVPVSTETARTLVCKKVENVIRRFVKTGPGWTIINKRKIIFLAIDGYGYICRIKDAIEERLSVREALIEVWGSEFYSKIPPKERDALESTNWGLTVGVTIPAEEDLPFKSSEDLTEEDRQKMLKDLANPDEKVPLVKSLMPIIFGFTLGIALTLVIVSLRGG